MSQADGAEAGFLADIFDNPEDDVPRLVFADWLTERGDPRGDLLRVQCQLARMPHRGRHREVLVATEQELLRQHGDTWRGGPPDGVDAVWFERGLASVSATPKACLSSVWPWWRRVSPWLAHLRVGRCTDNVLRILADERLADPTELDLSHAEITDSGLADLPAFSRLRVLHLGSTGVTDRGLEFVSRLAGLRRLYLPGTPITDAGMAWLASLKELRYLSLLGTGVTGVGLAHLRVLPHLGTLVIHGAHLHAADGADLWAALRRSGIVV
jgi:uncharacterized protein (TIGR02996 family)